MIQNHLQHSNNAISCFELSIANNSSKIIQSAFRSFKTRMDEKLFLPKDLHSLYIKECKKTETESMPMAKDGKTPTYFPIDLPSVVLKKTGTEQAAFRLKQMIEVRSVLNRINSSHLTIPKAAVLGKFIVEERLPINTDSHANIKLYRENHRLFVEPVREMTRLFSKCYISFLTCVKFDDVTQKYKVEDIRYDNIPFYLYNEKVFLGLIDLERANQAPDASDKRRLVSLAVIFPNHINIIAEEATKLGMVYQQRHLEIASRVSKEYQEKYS